MWTIEDGDSDKSRSRLALRRKRPRPILTYLPHLHTLNRSPWLSIIQNVKILRMLNISMERRNVFPRISYYFNKIASTYSGKVHIHRLEVEGKFLVIPVVTSYLRSNGGGSKFKKYRLLYFYGDKQEYESAAPLSYIEVVLFLFFIELEAVLPSQSDR